MKLSLPTFPNRRLRWFAACCVAPLLFHCPSAKADLTWGVGGNGGTASWDATTSDWWDGTSNVSWNGTSAIFGGASGTVTVAGLSANLIANTLTFNVAGYTLTGGWINSKNTATSLTIVANADVSIGTPSSTTIGNGVANGTLILSGTATLSFSGNLNYNTLQINSGEFRDQKVLSLGSSNVNFANTAGALLSLDGASMSVGGLSGGGTTGGVVQAAYSGSATTLQLSGGGSFAGVLQDNGSAKLSVSMTSFSSTQTLTGVNTYSGATTVTSGTLGLGGNGSALNTSGVTINNSGTFILDNTTAANANRLGSSTQMTVTGGNLEMLGNTGAAVTESLGNLKFGGAATVTTTNAGQTTELSFASITRNGTSTLNVAGNGTVTWAGIANANGNLIAPYITVGNEWATASGGVVAALSTYASSFTGANTDDVKLTGSGTTPLSGVTTRNSLNLQNSGGSTGVLDLGTFTFSVSSGGILTSGTNASQIQNGNLRSTNGELVVINNNALTISANIISPTASLTKSGTGTLTLTGTNTYTGNTNIDAGTLVVGSDAQLGSGLGAVINFGGGGLQASASFTSSKGFQNQSGFAGNIDTNGFNVTFTGNNSGGFNINKIGAGTLTETATLNGGTATAMAGTLALPSASGGNVNLSGGTLQANGTLTNLFLVQNSRLDIGGSAASTLTTNTFTPQTSSTLTVEFGLGANAASSDLWTVLSPVLGSTFSLVFDIQNLGGITTGKAYELMSVGSPAGITTSELSLSPADTAAGMAGSFSVVSNQVQVTFTSVPEPGGAGMLIGMGVGLGALGRFRRRG